MTEQTGTKPAETDEQGMASHAWKRRGLLAAAWAAVAAIVARQTTEPVQAGTDGDVVLNATNNTTGTELQNNGGGAALILSCTAGSYGLYASGGYTGVLGGCSGNQAEGAGVRGAADHADCYGVFGYNAEGVGVLGQSINGIAIRGQVPIQSSANTIAMYGLNYSTYTGSSLGAGGFGVYGLSRLGHGLVGATASPGAAAVVGATNGVLGAYAGAFYGPVAVAGAFTVFGGPKSAAVPHPDGTHRRLYCMESPESWFEDFGKGQLDCGQAEVTLDPDFAAVVRIDDYHVFLTGYDGQSDLSVCERTSSGFQVRATSGAGSRSFSWRVVAKRKDIPAPRFETVTVPHEPELPPLPQDEPVAYSGHRERAFRAS